VRHEDVHARRALERDLPREHLVHDDAERVDVRALVDVAALDLLGRHVLRGAHEESGLRELLLGPLAQVLHEPEVEHLHEVLVLLGHRGDGPRCIARTLVRTGEEDVGRLEVAMDDAELVRLAKGPADLRCDAAGAHLVHDAAFAERQVERLAFQILHRHEVDVVVGLAVVEDRDGVRVRDLRRDARLTEEAAVELGIGVAVVVGIEDLDRAEAPERRLLRSVDLPHSSTSDQRDDLEAIRDDATDQGIGCPCLRRRRLTLGHRRVAP
jgi:hypothetical protein